MIRDAEPGVVAHVAANVAPHVSVLSAGEAHLSHPTQGLLDALTVRQHKGSASTGCASRSWATSATRAWRARPTRCLPALGVGELRLVAPRGTDARGRRVPGCARSSDLEAGPATAADVVMMLRIQKERMAQAAIPDGDEYFARFGLTAPRLRLAHDRMRS